MKKLSLMLLLVGCGDRQPEHAATPVEPQPGAKSSEVLGIVDGVDAMGMARGWALAPSLQRYPIDVALYVDDEATPRVTVSANQPRSDVEVATKVPGDHGFSLAVPGALGAGNHTLHFFGLGPNEKVELGGSPRPYTRCASAGPKVAPADDEYVVTLKAFNGEYVSAECGGDDVGNVTATAGTAGELETFYVSLHDDSTVSVRSSHGRYFSIDGAALHASANASAANERFTLEGVLFDGTKVGFRAPDDAHWMTARLDLTPPPIAFTAPVFDIWEHFEVQVLVSPVKQRHGVVRAEHRTFVDDDGPFYPLGATLFWSLYGWKNERERVKQNLQWLARHRFDYVRILGEVDWAGEEIDPSWPDYAQVLGEFLDYAYDQCGLRVELTLVGGKGDPMVIAQKVAPVINAGRKHKILNLEVANESYQRPMTLQAMQAAGTWLLQNTSNLVALSSGEGLDAYAPGTTDWRADYARIYLPPGVANLGTIHMDRTQGDFGWREVRQPWDWKDLPFPVSHNEPIGPRSSVAEENDAIRLAMLRTVGIINGVGAFVLHNGAGVFGRVDPARNRPANLWEVPGIGAIMQAVRGVDRWLPPRLAEGQHWNNGWAGAPWNVDAFWGDGADHGVNRNYTVATGDGWVSTEAGVKDRAVFTSSRKSRVEIFDVLKGKTAEVTLNAGQTYTLLPDSRDGNGFGAFVIVGHYQ